MTPNDKAHNAFIIFTHNSFRDPLFYGTVIAYLRALNADRRYTFHVISYEQEQYRIPAGEQDAFDLELEKSNIYRYPLDWSSGGSFKLFRKGWEFLKGFFLARKLARRYNCKAIFALANVAGAFSYIIGKFSGLKVIVFTYEPHSEFMRDCGVWSESSIKYKLLHRMERKMGMKADYIATGTTHMVERLKDWGSTANVFRVPSCIDENVFSFSASAREQIRSELGIGNRPVFIYVGKFGDLYYKEEIALLCGSIATKIPGAFFILLTPNKKEEIAAMFAANGIEPEQLHIAFVPLEKVPAYMSAADMGIVAVPPLPSQKFRSPIKVGEYLCCGIPYIVCRSVSEDDTWAEKHNVGVVLENFSAAALHAQLQPLQQLLAENRDTQRQRCRETGIDYRSKRIAVTAFEKIFSAIYPQP